MAGEPLIHFTWETFHATWSVRSREHWNDFVEKHSNKIEMKVGQADPLDVIAALEATGVGELLTLSVSLLP